MTLPNDGVSQSGHSDTQSTNVYHQQDTASELRQQIVAVFDSFHNHTCQSCKGSGCINCRDTGMNQTPCLVCDEDGVAYRRRKKHVDELVALLAAQRQRWEVAARIDELATIPLQHGNYDTCTYVNGKQQTIESRYKELTAALDGERGKEQ